MRKVKTLSLKCKFESSGRWTLVAFNVNSCQNNIDWFVWKLVVDRILKINILDVMSADIRMTWLEGFNNTCY